MNERIAPSAMKIAVLLATASTPAAVSAATVNRAVYANAASYCQPALPVFDGKVRKRPLGVRNEGGGNAFVTCAFAAQAVDIDLAGIYFANLPGEDASISCTAVTGKNTGSNEYVTRTIVVSSSQQGAMFFNGNDFTGSPATIPGWGLFSVSCSLPQGTSIDDSFVQFGEEIGT